jgi:hypothetical protein
MIKSAFQIPHHVAMRNFQCVAPRRFSAENIGAGVDVFPHSGGKILLRGFPHSCAKVAPYSRFVWANSVNVIPPFLILDGPIIIDSRFRSPVPLEGRSARVAGAGSRVWACARCRPWSSHYVFQLRCAPSRSRRMLSHARSPPPPPCAFRCCSRARWQ